MEISEQQKVPKNFFFFFPQKQRKIFVLLSFSFVCLIFLLFFILFSVLWFISHIFLITTLSIFSLSFFFFLCLLLFPSSFLIFCRSLQAFEKEKKRASTFLLPLLLPIFYFLLNIVPFLSFTHKNASKHNMMQMYKWMIEVEQVSRVWI